MFEIPECEVFFLNSKKVPTRKPIYKLFKDKTILVLGVGSPFNPIDTQMVKDWEKAYDDLKAAGEVDEIYVLVIASPATTDAWFKSMKIKKLKPIPDGNAAFALRLEGTFGLCSGTYVTRRWNRGENIGCWRTAWISEDAIVMKHWEEEWELAQDVRHNCDIDPYDEMKPDKMIVKLKSRNQKSRISEANASGNIDPAAPA
tara:strand:- start:2047 stop:2649 length:603 start_codon:yes stop_codon:yes gene_type:complete